MREGKNRPAGRQAGINGEWMDGDRWTDGWGVGGWRDRWMDRRMNGWIDIRGGWGEIVGANLVVHCTIYVEILACRWRSQDWRRCAKGKMRC